MSAENDKLFRKVLKYAKADEPALNFTSVIMEEILAETENAADPILKHLLKDHKSVVHDDFTSNIMEAIAHQQVKNKIRPFNFHLGPLIAAVLAVILLVLILTDQQTVASTEGRGLYTQVIAFVSSTPFTLVLTVIISAFLLLMDHLLNNRKKAGTL